jgi:hypothetical protein
MRKTCLNENDIFCLLDPGLSRRFDIISEMDGDQK